jgi:DNA-binding MarR family transcriptional regulator
VSLTLKGRRLAERVEESSRDRFDRLLEAVPVGARDGVIRSLDLLNDAIAELQKLEGT